MSLRVLAKSLVKGTRACFQQSLLLPPGYVQPRSVSPPAGRRNVFQIDRQLSKVGGLKNVFSALRSSNSFSSPAPLPAQYREAFIPDEHLNGPPMFRGVEQLNSFAREIQLACERTIEEIEGIEARTVQTPEDAQAVMGCVDSLSNMLCLVLDPLDWALANNTVSEDFADAANAIFADLTNYMAILNTKTFFWTCLTAIRDRPDLFASLSDEQRFLVKSSIRDLEAGGVHLPQGQKDKLVELSDKSTQLNAMFAEKFGSTPPALLRGSERKELLGLLDQAIGYRNEVSWMLSGKSFAAAQIEVTAAGSVDNVLTFLNSVGRGLRPQVEAEKCAIGATAGTTDFALDSRIARHASLLAGKAFGCGYLTLPQVLEGLRFVLRTSFALDMVEVALSPAEAAWAPAGMLKFHLFNPLLATPTEQFIGTVYMDALARDDKPPGAGHFTLQVGCKVYRQQQGVPTLAQRGARQKPILVLSANVNPSRLSLEDAETLFHEMGHVMHSLCGQCDSQQYSGTRTSLDFCEFPSQLMEVFIRDHRSYSAIVDAAGGANSPAAMSAEAHAAALATRSLSKSLLLMQNVVQSMWDVVIHNVGPHDGGIRRIPRVDGDGVIELSADVPLPKVYEAVSSEYLGVTGTDSQFWKVFSMQHFDTYASVYYSYLFSQSYVRMVWSRLFKQHPLDPDAGRRLVSEILRLGGACHPNEALSKYTRLEEPLTPKQLADVLVEHPFM